MFSTSPKSINATIFGRLYLNSMEIESKARLWQNNTNNIARYHQSHWNNII